MVSYGMVEVSKGGKWVQPTLPLSPEREITEILCSPPMAPILPNFHCLHLAPSLLPHAQSGKSKHLPVLWQRVFNSRRCSSPAPCLLQKSRSSCSIHPPLYSSVFPSLVFCLSPIMQCVARNAWQCLVLEQSPITNHPPAPPRPKLCTLLHPTAKDISSSSHRSAHI